MTFTLTPTSAGTRLRMEQSEFRLEEERNFAGARYGWQRYFDGLERVAGDVRAP